MTAPTTTARGKHHRRAGPALPEPPGDLEKISYRWRPRPAVAVALTVTLLAIATGQLWIEFSRPVLLIFAAYSAAFAASQLLNLPVVLGGRGFDAAGHADRVASWQPVRYPDVDIYLPICGEPAAVLRNTWTGVFELIHAYQGVARAFVLDDGPSDEAGELSESFGFSYLRRPDLRQHAKAGNLNYAFGRSCAPFLAVFDAGFRPRADFLAETLPCFDDPATGIVQTASLLRVSADRTWVERATAASMESFFRIAQVSSGQSGSALCTGTGSVYRRAALAPAGGFTPATEGADGYCGLDVRRNGYRLTYLPVALAAGSAPASLEDAAWARYRAASTATALVWTAGLWRVPMPRLARLPYVTGWLCTLMAALRALLLPLVPVVVLVGLAGEATFRTVVVAVLGVLIVTAAWSAYHQAPWDPRRWLLAYLTGWSDALAIWDFAWRVARPENPEGVRASVLGRFWLALRCWTAGLAAAWAALAIWRITQAHSVAFVVLALAALGNLLLLRCLIAPATKKGLRTLTLVRGGPGRRGAAR